MELNGIIVQKYIGQCVQSNKSVNYYSMDYFLEYILEYVTNNVTDYQSDDVAYVQYMLEHVSCDKQYYITSYFCNYIRFYFKVYHDFLEYCMDYWLDKYLELKLCCF